MNKHPRELPDAQTGEATLQEQYVILSDLHLAEGVEPTSRRVSRLENFYFDREFQDLLFYLEEQHTRSGTPWVLVINGDLIDFLRVTSLPQTPEELRGLPHLSQTKKRYGLGTSPAESKWQLEKVIAGHPVVFRALAWFALQGNRIVIVRGNHDVNWFWPAVRYRFLEKMEEFMREICHSCNRDDTEVALAVDRIEIRQWVFYVKGLLYVEHGNQYDPSNAFRHFLYPLLIDPDSPVGLYELDLPFGSFFVRYFFNKIEYYNPRAANYRYSSSYFNTLWGRHFYEFWNVVRSYFPYFFRTLRKLRTHEVQNYREINEHHQRELEAIGEKEYQEREAFRQIAALSEAHAYVSRYDFLFAVLKQPLKKAAAALGTVILLLFIGNLLSQAVLSSNWNLLLKTTLGLFIDYGFLALCLVAALLFLRPTPDVMSYREAEPLTLRQKAAHIAKLLKVRYVCFGHSHVEDFWKIPGSLSWYFNTGTWTPLIDPENQIVRPEIHFPLVVIEKGHASFMQWDDRRKCLVDKVFLEERSH